MSVSFSTITQKSRMQPVAATSTAMRRALGVHTMQRGHDPARLSLVAFGGGGGLHAAALARALGMPGALVPAHPGVLSAWGMLHADAQRDRTLAVLEPLSCWGPRARTAAFRELEAAAGKAATLSHPPSAVAQIDTRVPEGAPLDPGDTPESQVAYLEGLLRQVQDRRRA